MVHVTCFRIPEDESSGNFIHDSANANNTHVYDNH